MFQWNLQSKCRQNKFLHAFLEIFHNSSNSPSSNIPNSLSTEYLIAKILTSVLEVFYSKFAK